MSYNREYYEKNKERLKAAARAHYHANKEQRREANRAWYQKNKDKAKAANKRWREKNADRVREQAEKRTKLVRFARHGISEEQYQEMENSQRGLCAICRRACDVVGTLSIDHDHETGRVRGLLCKRCNSGLGFFRENPDLLIWAGAYLRHWESA